MATFVKYDQFAVDLAAGVHTLTTAGSTLKLALTNTAPTTSTDAVLADITEIAYTNISSPTMPADITNVGAENPAGTWEVSGTDVTITASGTVADFQYVVLYNDTPTSPVDPLIGYWDYGSTVSLSSGETFTVDFGAIIFTVA
jgi:hypothetical protein